MKKLYGEHNISVFDFCNHLIFPLKQPFSLNSDVSAPIKILSFPAIPFRLFAFHSQLMQLKANMFSALEADPFKTPGLYITSLDFILFTHNKSH